MDRETELTLIDEVLGLKASNAAFCAANVSKSPVAHYTSTERFAAERQKVFLTAPYAIAHATELPTTGSFLSQDIAGQPVLVTRDKAGDVHAFLNVCRHRGTRLTEEPAGCKNRFSCPYHAWTYANTGELIAAPHFDQGFEGEDKQNLGLTRLPCAERFGFVWVIPTPSQTMNFDSQFDGLAADLEALGLDDLTISGDSAQTRAANWKILVEGGIEAYHFKVAHRNTIGPYFEENLSTYRAFGPHLRSILPRNTITDLVGKPRDTWRLREHANILYTVFPSFQLLVQQDHSVWINMQPLAPDATHIRIVTLAPAPAEGAEETNEDHWRRNHMITTTTLDEDFAIGESIQANAGSGANTHMLFGRFESALSAFNNTVDQRVGA